MKFLEKNIMDNKNTHGTHSEDLIFKGAEACDVLLDALEDSIDGLRSTKSTHITTIKVDGAPAVVCASDYNGEYFVSTKSALNKDMKVARTPEDIDKIWPEKSDDFKTKMKTLLKWVPLLKIPKNEMWQGDFLFNKADLKLRKIDGEKCITFQPNTIVYAIPLTDPMVTSITRADAGVVWHTRYILHPDGSRTSSFNVHVEDLQRVPAIFMIDANIPDFSGKVKTSSEDAIEIEKHYKEIKRLIPQLLNDPNYLSVISTTKVMDVINRFKNNMVTKDIQTLTADDWDAFINFKMKDFEKKKYSSEKTRQKGLERFLLEVDKLEEYKPTIILAWLIQNHIVDIKEIFIKYLNSKTRARSYLLKKDGSLDKTNGEGFVISDIDGNAQKWVSRLQFSKANFSPEYIKGWTSDRRQNEENSYKEKINTLKKNSLTEDIIESNIQSAMDQVEVENKKDIYYRSRPTAKRTYTLEPTVDSTIKPENIGKSQEDLRKEKAQLMFDLLKEDPDAIEPDLDMKGGRGGTTPTINLNMENSLGGNEEVELQFKPRDDKGGSSATSTEADEVYWAYCMSAYQNHKEELLPNNEIELENTSLTFLGLKEDQLPKKSNFIGYTKGSKLFCDSYLDRGEEYYFFRENLAIDAQPTPRSSIVHIESLHTLIDEAAYNVMSRGFQKDVWNPADIVACKKRFYSEFVKNWNQMLKNVIPGDFSKFNEYLLECFSNKNLVCISLKDIVKGNPRVIEQNTEVKSEEELLEEREENSDKPYILKEIKFPAMVPLYDHLKKYPGNSPKELSFKVSRADDPSINIKFQYRTSGSTTMQLEGTESGASAHLGKTSKDTINQLYNEYLIHNKKELNFRDSLKLMIYSPEDLQRELLLIKTSHLPLNQTGGLDLSFKTWMDFCKNMRPNDKLEEVAYSTWPRIIDFLYLLASQESNLNSILNIIVKGCTKTMKGCAPFIKLC